MASLEGLKWTSILVLFGRTSCASFGTSTRRPWNVPFGRPQVRYGRSVDVYWTSAGPLGCEENLISYMYVFSLMGQDVNLAQKIAV